MTDYYPFGMQITPASDLPSNTNPYLYGGKEFDRMHSLNEADFSARWLDNTIPGFTSPDPLLERHPWESPYLYCGGDPVNRTDPTGLDWCTNSPNPTHNDLRYITDYEEVLGFLDNFQYRFKVFYIIEGDYAYFFDGEGHTQITMPEAVISRSTTSSNSLVTFGSFGIAPDRSGEEDEEKSSRFVLEPSKLAYSSTIKGMVTLDNKESYTRDVSLRHPTLVAKAIKDIYKSKWGSDLDIGTKSLALEIGVHALLSKEKNLPGRTDLADCGESNVDGNRFIWDAIIDWCNNPVMRFR